MRIKKKRFKFKRIKKRFELYSFFRKLPIDSRNSDSSHNVLTNQNLTIMLVYEYFLYILLTSKEKIVASISMFYKIKVDKKNKIFCNQEF